MNAKKNIAPAPDRKPGMTREDSGNSSTPEAPFRLGRWLLGWVAAPLSLLLVIFVGGVHVGARNPDLWPLEVIRWIAETTQSLFGAS